MLSYNIMTIDFYLYIIYNDGEIVLFSSTKTKIHAIYMSMTKYEIRQNIICQYKIWFLNDKIWFLNDKIWFFDDKIYIFIFCQDNNFSWQNMVCLTSYFVIDMRTLHCALMQNASLTFKTTITWCIIIIMNKSYIRCKCWQLPAFFTMIDPNHIIERYLFIFEEYVLVC